MWVLIVLDKGRIAAIQRPLFRKRYTLVLFWATYLELVYKFVFVHLLYTFCIYCKGKNDLYASFTSMQIRFFRVLTLLTKGRDQKTFFSLFVSSFLSHP
jgi:hypothetical protein